MRHEPPLLIAFETCARRDPRFWVLLVVGLVFVWGSFAIDPQTNCSEGGECAPWLVPIAGLLGALAVTAGLTLLIANPSRGSRLDTDAGLLEWWQGRRRGTPGNSGTIALTLIGRILIRRDSDGDEISLYDLNGQRLAYFDREVIGTSPEDWARRLNLAVPAIRVEISG